MHLKSNVYKLVWFGRVELTTVTKSIWYLDVHIYKVHQHHSIQLNARDLRAHPPRVHEPFIEFGESKLGLCEREQESAVCVCVWATAVQTVRNSQKHKNTAQHNTTK